MALEKLWKASHPDAACLAGIQKVLCSALTEKTGKMNFSRAQQYRDLSNTRSMLYWFGLFCYLFVCLFVCFAGFVFVLVFAGFVVVVIVFYIVLELISEKVLNLSVCQLTH